MNMATPHFKVFISYVKGSIEDWEKALNAPRAELPKLNEKQKEVARKIPISEEDYARGVMVEQYGEDRQRERGEILGRRIEELLEGLPYRLQAIIWEGLKPRWVARIYPRREPPKNIAIEVELADDVIDSATVQDLERLRVLILESLGEKNLLGSLQ
jgi:hypothetical protein